MTDCRTCGALDCINVDDYDVYSLQQPSVIAAAQSGNIALSNIVDSDICVGDTISFNITASGDSVNGFSEWSVLGGSLPTGLTLYPHGTYATISGEPTASDNFIFSLLVESTNGDRGAKVYSISSTDCGGCTGEMKGGIDSVYSVTYSPINQDLLITGYTSVFASSVILYDPETCAEIASNTIASGSVDSPVYIASDGLGYVLDATTGNLYYLNASGSQLGVVDLTAYFSNSASGIGPRDIASDGVRLFLYGFSASGDSTVVSVRLDDYSVEATIDLTALGYFQNLSQILYVPSDDRVYLTSESNVGPFEEQLIKLNPATLAFDGALELDPAATTAGPIAYCSSNKCVYISRADGRMAVVDVDPASGAYFTIVATIDKSANTGYMNDIVYAESIDRVLALHAQEDGFGGHTGTTYVYVINPSTNTVVRTITAEPNVYSYHMSWHPILSQVFLTNDDTTPAQVISKDVWE